MRLRQDRGTLPAALRAVALRPPSVQVHDQGKVMSVSRRMTMACAVAATAAVALSACSGSPLEVATSSQQPSSSSTAPPPTTSTSTTTTSAAPTSTSTTTPVDPVIARLPIAARRSDVAGAEAFARYFFDALNKAAQKPDADLLNNLFEQSCRTCIAMQNTVKQLQQQGRRYSADTIRVKQTLVNNFASDNKSLQVVVEQLAVDIKSQSGKTLGRTPAGSGEFVAAMRFGDRGWQLTSLQTATR